MSESTITAAVESFDDWTRPWTFHATACAAAGLSDADRRVVDAMWTEACNESHWKDGLEQGCGLANDALATRFPWLSTAARRQVVRAASYQWR